MRSFQVAIIIGAIIALVGAGMLYPVRPETDTYNDFIGPNQYLWVELDIFFAGRVSGDYAESAGNSLTLHVYTANDFLTFTTQSTQSTPQGLFSTSGNSRTFSTNVPTPGKYYVVIRHGLGNEGTTQTFTLNVTLDGMNSMMLGLSVGMIALGAIIAVVGYRAKKKAEPRQPPSTQGVVLFDQPQTPPPPSE